MAPLEALVAAGHEVPLVVSRADTRRGRGGGSSPSAVKQAALGLGLRVTDVLDDVTGAGAELGVVVAYGRIVPQRILDVLPMVNVHFSLLPRWRGAAPVERAILAGDGVTGVCVMRLEAGLDTGPVLASRSLAVGEDEHAGALTARLSAAGAALAVDVLGTPVAGLPPGRPQEGEPTYAAKLEPEELRLDWTAPAALLHRVVRLDRAWTTFRGERLRVLEARVLPHPAAGAGGDGAAAGAGSAPGAISWGGEAPVVRCGSGVLALVRVQPAGRRPVEGADWGRGVRLRPGEVVGESAP